ncbi:conserved hypothetical protein [Vibrio chagasii]|nr:conserved hypothetical protein [Vibrio chagasii]CAH7345294.1 conserved hypothetical protein [Vibrio chagasii]
MNQKLFTFLKGYFDINGVFLPKISENVVFSDASTLANLKDQIANGEDLLTEPYRIVYKSLFQPLVVSRSTEVDLSEALTDCKDTIEQISPSRVKNPNFTRKLGVLGYWLSNDPLTYMVKVSCLLDGGKPLFMDSIDEVHNHLLLMSNRLEKTAVDIVSYMNHIRLIKVAYEQHLLFDSLFDIDVPELCDGNSDIGTDKIERLNAAFSSYSEVRELELLCDTYCNELSPKLQGNIVDSLKTLDKLKADLSGFWVDMSSLISCTEGKSISSSSIDKVIEDKPYEIIDGVLFLGVSYIENKRTEIKCLLHKSECDFQATSLDFNRYFSMYTALLTKVDVRAREGLKVGDVILS